MVNHHPLICPPIHIQKYVPYIVIQAGRGGGGVFLWFVEDSVLCQRHCIHYSLLKALPSGPLC